LPDTLEELVKLDAESVQHALAGVGRRVRMFAVDDIGPVATREPQLPRPVILAQTALGEEPLQTVQSKTNAHSEVRRGYGLDASRGQPPTHHR